jgi:hypothetical protein
MAQTLTPADASHYRPTGPRKLKPAKGQVYVKVKKVKLPSGNNSQAN